MSTRSMVAIKQADGKLLGMWKHWDGSPTFMLSLLNDYGRFTEDELAEELVKILPNYQIIAILSRVQALQRYIRIFGGVSEKI